MISSKDSEDISVPRQHEQTTFDIQYHKRGNIPTADWQYPSALPRAPVRNPSHAV